MQKKTKCSVLVGTLDSVLGREGKSSSISNNTQDEEPLIVLGVLRICEVSLGRGGMRQTSWPIRCRLQDVAVPSRACTTPLLNSTTTGPGRTDVFLAVQRTRCVPWSAVTHSLVPECRAMPASVGDGKQQQQVWAEV